MQTKINPNCPLHGHLANKHTDDEIITAIRASTPPEEWAGIASARVNEASLAEIADYIESNKHKVKYL